MTLVVEPMDKRKWTGDRVRWQKKKRSQRKQVRKPYQIEEKMSRRGQEIEARAERIILVGEYLYPQRDFKSQVKDYKRNREQRPLFFKLHS